MRKPRPPYIHVPKPPKPCFCPNCHATRLQNPCEHCGHKRRPWVHQLGDGTPVQCKHCRKTARARLGWSRKHNRQKFKLPKFWRYSKKAKGPICQDCRKIYRHIGIKGKRGPLPITPPRPSRISDQEKDFWRKRP